MEGLPVSDLQVNEKLTHAHRVIRYNILLRQAIEEQPKEVRDQILRRVNILLERLDQLV